MMKFARAAVTAALVVTALGLTGGTSSATSIPAPASTPIGAARDVAIDPQILDFNTALMAAGMEFTMASSVGATMGGVIGLGVGCGAGAAIGTATTLPLALLFGGGPIGGCLIGAGMGSAIGATIGAAAVGIPVGVASAVKFQQTLNSAQRTN